MHAQPDPRPRRVSGVTRGERLRGAPGRPAHAPRRRSRDGEAPAAGARVPEPPDGRAPARPSRPTTGGRSSTGTALASRLAVPARRCGSASSSVRPGPRGSSGRRHWRLSGGRSAALPHPSGDLDADEGPAQAGEPRPRLGRDFSVTSARRKQAEQNALWDNRQTIPGRFLLSPPEPALLGPRRGRDPRGTADTESAPCTHDSCPRPGAARTRCCPRRMLGGKSGTEHCRGERRRGSR
jgi:hypothetical protein